MSDASCVVCGFGEQGGRLGEGNVSGPVSCGVARNWRLFDGRSPGVGQFNWASELLLLRCQNIRASVLELAAN